MKKSGQILPQQKLDHILHIQKKLVLIQELQINK
jgi:hypothetical protein